MRKYITGILQYMQENIAKIISLKRDYYTEGNHIQRLFDILNENMSMHWSIMITKKFISNKFKTQVWYLVSRTRCMTWH